MAANDDARWSAEQGSVLDPARMRALENFDIVYSWGVLHHTGALWEAMDNAIIPRKQDGVVYLALYSSDQYVDPPAAHWVKVKRAYNKRNAVGKRMMEWKHASKLFVSSLRQGVMPWTVVRDYGVRGMDFWTDIKDWLGGWPIEFASYAEVDAWGRANGLTIVNASVGEGCTEYILADPAHNAQWKAEDERRAAITRPLAGPFTRGSGHTWVAQLPAHNGEGDDAHPPISCSSIAVVPLDCRTLCMCTSQPLVRVVSRTGVTPCSSPRPMDRIPTLILRVGRTVQSIERTTH